VGEEHVFVSETAEPTGVWVIDAGAFMALRDLPREGAQLGAFVEGDVYLGTDSCVRDSGPEMP
jgi:hypothetical protein